MRKIPSTMATQHPDNAGDVYWLGKPFVSTRAELEECYRCFSELGIEEYNWDWEGKFVDEAVTERLLHDYGDFFLKKPLGREFFLTFRIPNPRVEKQSRLARAYMVILTAASLARQYNFYSPPIFEVILPLTETSEELIGLQEAFRELSGLKHKLLGIEGLMDGIEVIPLFEQVEKIMDSTEVLDGYVSLHKQKFGFKPAYLRPYFARSDPALNSGLIPTVLAIKIALSSYLDFEKEKNIPLYPLIGTGSLPFRGGINPRSIKRFVKEYEGVKTAIIQSAFRYDYPLKEVKHGIKELTRLLPKGEQKHLTVRQVRLLKEAIPIFTKNYQMVIEGIAPLVNEVASSVPKRRERLLHIGLFGYSRGVGKVRLPRAISFTASLYSLGIPPELIGAGRGIVQAKASGLLETVLKTYIHLEEELQGAGRFLNKENLRLLARDHEVFHLVQKDVELLEQFLGIRFEPANTEEKKHQSLTYTLYRAWKANQEISELITQTGILRRSLG